MLNLQYNAALNSNLTNSSSRCIGGLFPVLCEVVSNSLHVLHHYEYKFFNISHKTENRIGGGMADSFAYRYVFLTEFCILCGPLQESQELVSPLSRLLAPQAIEVFTRLGINHLTPNLDADLAVLVQDTVVCHALVDAEEAVI